jgi:formate hydrogenlyase subunit 3/multisubunit Na+/H+ antiporter MnhD subunit
MLKEISHLLPWIPFVPLAAALVIFFWGKSARVQKIGFLFGTVPGLLLAGILAAEVMSKASDRPLVFTAWGEYLYADGLTVMMLLCVFLLVLGVGIYSFPYMEKQRERGLVTERGLRMYYAVLLVFCASMSWTVSFNNLVFMFLAIEVSTIATAFLVSLYKSRQALEAAFKYNLLVIMAVVFALLGVIIIYAKMSATVPGLTAIRSSRQVNPLTGGALCRPAESCLRSRSRWPSSSRRVSPRERSRIGTHASP